MGTPDAVIAFCIGVQEAGSLAGPGQRPGGVRDEALTEAFISKPFLQRVPNGYAFAGQFGFGISMDWKGGRPARQRWQ
ncbi:MAG: hypothetical protein HQL62_00575 [Magnetococcales bacterium]|nr:hypothetical protein [Magnetococcales bacterium]